MYCEIVTANLGQVFLFQVPRLIAIFVITFAILKKFLANFLRNIANLLGQLKTPHFLLETPHFLFEAPQFLLAVILIFTLFPIFLAYKLFYQFQLDKKPIRNFCYLCNSINEFINFLHIIVYYR